MRQVLHNRNRQCSVSSLGTFASSITCLNSDLSGRGPGDRVTAQRYPNKWAAIGS